MEAFRATAYSERYPVQVVAAKETIDLGIVGIPAPLGEGLPRGSADTLRQMDHLAIAGFPNYRLGDSGVISPGLVVGFRPMSGIRRVLTNAPIIAGMSGSPAIDREHRVVGVAVTGADRMERAHGTENHGIVPIDALAYLGQ